MNDLAERLAFAAYVGYLRRKADFHFERSKAHYRRWRLKAKFDPNQPRIPAGQPGGGQWTDHDHSTETSATRELDEFGEQVAAQSSEAQNFSQPKLSDLVVAARRRRVNDAECWEQYRRDTFFLQYDRFARVPCSGIAALCGMSCRATHPAT